MVQFYDPAKAVVPELPLTLIRLDSVKHFHSQRRCNTCETCGLLSVFRIYLKYELKLTFLTFLGGVNMRSIATLFLLHNRWQYYPDKCFSARPG